MPAPPTQSTRDASASKTQLDRPGAQESGPEARIVSSPSSAWTSAARNGCVDQPDRVRLGDLRQLVSLGRPDAAHLQPERTRRGHQARRILGRCRTCAAESPQVQSGSLTNGDEFTVRKLRRRGSADARWGAGRRRPWVAGRPRPPGSRGTTTTIRRRAGARRAAWGRCSRGPASRSRGVRRCL